MRFNDRPAESFETRRIQQRDRGRVKRFKQFALGVLDLNNAFRNVELASERFQLAVQTFADKNKPAIPFILDAREDPQNAIAIFARCVCADVQNEGRTKIDIGNLAEVFMGLRRRQFSIGVIQAQWHHRHSRSGVAANDETLHVLRRDGGNACDQIGAAQTA